MINCPICHKPTIVENRKGYAFNWKCPNHCYFYNISDSGDLLKDQLCFNHGDLFYLLDQRYNLAATIVTWNYRIKINSPGFFDGLIKNKVRINNILVDYSKPLDLPALISKIQNIFLVA